MNTLKIHWKRALLMLLVMQAPLLQAGCGYVAAGAVGAAVGHEVSEHNDDDDDD